MFSYEDFFLLSPFCNGSNFWVCRLVRPYLPLLQGATVSRKRAQVVFRFVKSRDPRLRMAASVERFGF